MNVDSRLVSGPDFSGRILVARPGMVGGGQERAVILVCSHTVEGTMGIVLNRPERTLGFRDIFEQLHIMKPGDGIDLPERFRTARIGDGGSLEKQTGYVLHSGDYVQRDDTIPICEGLGLSMSREVLRAMAQGRGPKRATLAFGHTHWESGQLERELVASRWFVCPPDDSLLYGVDFENKYEAALMGLGLGSGVSRASVVDYHGTA